MSVGRLAPNDSVKPCQKRMLIFLKTGLIKTKGLLSGSKHWMINPPRAHVYALTNH